jgi:methylglutaconyl-CoA hydratase/polyketide biosynthesis enoyl-CoA hydratase PksH
MSTIIQYQNQSGVARIRLAAVESGNALNLSLVEQLSHAIKEAINDQSCRVITISAEGPDFCRGLELQQVLDSDGKVDPALFQLFLDCLLLICESAKPVIACVEGNVSGGGVGLVAACDIVFANEEVVFMLPEVIVGMIPALIGPFLLRRLTPARSRTMALSSRGIKAPEAKTFGLVDEVVSESMNVTLNRQLKRLFRSNPLALAESKQYFDKLANQRLRQQTEVAKRQLISWLSQPQVIAGIQTFAEGYSPPWFQRYKANRKK